MPKDKRLHSLTSNHCRASPYSNSSSGANQCKVNIPLGSTEDVKEWEDARCPICMENPHNAVLLQCASSEKGCRPYMCNTSQRHSNCLDQFCKSSVSSPSTAILGDAPSSGMTSNGSGEEALPRGSIPCDGLQQKLVCPLCRGQISGWIVKEPARQLMNCKRRSCSTEACDFVGTYSELRKHARIEHPSVRPTEVDPERQNNWTRLENQRDLEDVLSTFQLIAGEENDWMGLEHLIDGDDILGDLLSEELDELDSSIYFENHVDYQIDLCDFIASMEVLDSSFSMSWDSPIRGQVQGSSTSETMHTVGYARETNHTTGQSNRWRPWRQPEDSQSLRQNQMQSERVSRGASQLRWRSQRRSERRSHGRRLHWRSQR